ncbi:hypothetical protein [Pseudohongiella sp.]|nr:hypothetical protein [Pseudohongiella sp.]HDZ10160.1 hypothetical protein [Pseudohongiella sp.]HEA64309.1 hypothetical protein [Pseudohongiella sp.]
MPDSRLYTSNPDTRPSVMTGLLAALLLATSVSIHADELSDPGIWHGEWQAEDTDFTLLVLPSGTNFRLEPLRPAGIEWQAGEGLINGSSGTVEVSYQGVVAQVMVQLTSPETAVVRSMSCQPDYHVVCTLVRNQQARFIKLQ